MNFTREPIIETIITPREGFKLVVRNSKGGSQEEYSVDAIEVVSFGHSFFFRSLERPKSFLVPVSDYEVLEVKETRVVLKTPGVEKTIKIGGGREASIKAPREEKAGEPQVAEAKKPGEQRIDKKRERRRHRRRRGGQEEGKEGAETLSPTTETPEPSISEPALQGGDATDETKVSSSMFSRLFPPPPSLISETLGRDKKRDEEAAKGDLPSEQITPEEKTSKRDDEDDEQPPRQGPPDQPWGGDSQEMMRQVAEPVESMTSNSLFRIFWS